LGVFVGGKWWRRWVSSGSGGDGLEKRGDGVVVLGEKSG
nr:hypothetical protein [Tanacetum cinerariifolium]